MINTTTKPIYDLIFNCWCVLVQVDSDYSLQCYDEFNEAWSIYKGEQQYV